MVSFLLFPKPWHLSLLHLMWREAKQNRKKQPKQRSKDHHRTNLSTHEFLTEKDTGFMFSSDMVSKGNRAEVCPCWTDKRWLTWQKLPLTWRSALSSMPDFYIDTDSVYMSTRCLPSPAEHILDYLSLALAGKFGNSQQKWLQALITVHISYPAFSSFIII